MPHATCSSVRSTSCPTLNPWPRSRADCTALRTPGYLTSGKKEALQALSIPKNVVWNPLTFCGKEIDESVDRGGDTLVNQRIRLG